MKRRDFTKKTTMAVGAGFSTSLMGFNIKRHFKEDENIIGHGDYKYNVIKDWARLDPVKNPVLNCHEMVMDSKGRLIMITDEIKNNIFIYDKSGKLLDTWGTWFPGGHVQILTTKK